ncbi:PQQ-binding-like beta-propeller repeat protein [Streptomyces sp. NPDC051064]|uniref:outer membrane protein assembly factor BamB family protein n=1 Tax=Streptomyces sp. NPDC051064 TaxID=3365641 RepID=UPI0037A0FAAA
MTQPPSQQPPQGGFGAPQDPQGTPQPTPPATPPQMPPAPPQTPPPGAPQTSPPAQPGYGYPQAPGAQPGYGYPQAPGQAPGQAAPGPYAQQPGPYGAPSGPYAQQPGPYAQQPGPYGQQPGYGYPQQQYPGAPAPTPGSGGSPFKGKPAVIIGAALAVLLVVGGGIFFATSGGDDDPKKPVAKSSSGAPDPSGSPSVDQGDGKGDGREANDDLNAGRKDGEAKVLWTTANDIDLPRNGADVYGPWIVGDTLVKGMYRSVVGISVGDGKQKWSLPLPADICSAPATATADGKIVVGVMSGTTDKANCSVLQMIDLNTGKAGWKKTVTKNGTWDLLTNIGLAISGDTVTVGRTSNSSAYRVSDGKELFGNPDGNCKPYAFAGGPKLIAAVNCSTGDVENPQQQVQELDPTTGKAKWTYQVKRGWEVDKVYSVSPLVVSLTQYEEKKWAIVAIEENGTLRSQLAGDDEDKVTVECGGGIVDFADTLEGCGGLAADANTFYMMTKDDTSGTSRTNKVVAFDLNTGKVKWKAPAPAERTMKPLRMEGGNVLVYMEPSYEEGGAIATIAPTGGAPKVLLQHLDSTAQIENFYSSKTVYAGGRSFVVSDRVSGNDDSEGETTIMAFGK